MLASHLEEARAQPGAAAKTLEAGSTIAQDQSGDAGSGRTLAAMAHRLLRRLAVPNGRVPEAAR